MAEPSLTVGLVPRALVREFSLSQIRPRMNVYVAGACFRDVISVLHYSSISCQH